MQGRELNPPVKSTPQADHQARVRAILEDPANHAKWAGRPVREKSKAPKKVDVNARTADWLRDNGYAPWRCDHWDDKGKVARDLFGILDFIGIGGGETVGCQTTTKANMAARRSKILNSTWHGRLKASGWRILLLGWHKRGHLWEAQVEWL